MRLDSSPRLTGAARRPRMHLVAFVCALAPATAAPQCTSDLTSIGVPPLCDLGPAFYAGGHTGGLYPGGSSVRPPSLDAALVAVARDEVLPRDASGAVDLVAGRIGLVSIGMSNTSQEFSGGAGTFLPRASADPAVNPRVTIINGAQGGQAAEDWAHSEGPWDTLASRVAAAGLSPEQVAAVWIKYANRQPNRLGAFPAHARSLQDDLRDILRRLRATYPRLALAFLSSRTRAYTDNASGLNPEPFAFESGFAVRWLIEDQLAGAGGLDPELGEAPWLSWGPYLWVDGEVPRSDGPVWLASDLSNDCTHPSPSGRVKVADQLLAFFKTDTATAPWFLRPVESDSAPIVDVVPLALSGPAPLTVAFAASATSRSGDPVSSFAWNFADGTTSLESSPTKTFLHPGTYPVQLVASDAEGRSALVVVPIEVTGKGGPVPPVILGPPSPLEPASTVDEVRIQFAASGTPPLTWGIESGELPPGITLSSSGLYSGRPEAPGHYRFTVRVANDAGMDTAELEQAVEDPSPSGTLLRAAADAYVRSGRFAASNYGSATRLAVRGSSSPDGTAIAILRFDVSRVAELESCRRIRLVLRLESGESTAVPVTVVAAADDSWQEDTVTFETLPPGAEAIGTLTHVPGTNQLHADITQAVLEAAADDGLLSLRLEDRTLSEAAVFLISREAGDEGPLLEVECDGAEPAFRRGDANSDGEVDISDPVLVLLFLFAGQAALACADAGDGDDSGGLEITDAVFLLDSLFRGGPLPPPPHPGCSVDPTADDLECTRPPPCS